MAKTTKTTKQRIRRTATVRAAERRVLRAFHALQQAVETLGDALATLEDVVAQAATRAR